MIDSLKHPVKMARKYAPSSKIGEMKRSMSRRTVHSVSVDKEE